MNNRLIKFLS